MMNFSTENTIDEKYMKRCLDLAARGSQGVKTNPLVGCCIVYNGAILAEGYHEKFGQAHAEINALNKVQYHQRQLLPESTLYVNLEPCSHFGKTPPCAFAIVKNKLGRVVIGMKDPNPKVDGRGIKILRKAGIDVTYDVLRDRCIELNNRFLINQNESRPSILLKWAESIDGFIGRKDQRILLSCAASNTHMHAFRAKSDAILIGSGTALADDPSLTTRHVPGTNPQRIILEGRNQLPADLNVYQRSEKTWIVTEHKTRAKTGNFEIIEIVDHTDLEYILNRIHKKNIGSLMVEGGRKILMAFIEAGIWDEAIIIKSNKKVIHGIKAPKLQGTLISKIISNTDEIHYLQKG